MIQQMSIAVRSADRRKSMMKIPAGFVWNWGIRYTVYAQNGLSCWHSYGDGADSPVGLGVPIFRQMPGIFSWIQQSRSGQWCRECLQNRCLIHFGSSAAKYCDTTTHATRWNKVPLLSAGPLGRFYYGRVGNLYPNSTLCSQACRAERMPVVVMCDHMVTYWNNLKHGRNDSWTCAKT